jgi:urease accessory protein
VRPGASLTVRSVAAQLAHPCPHDGATELRVQARVGAGGRLAWLPEPTIVAGGGNHRTRASVVLDDGAVALWSEELVLGRTGEDPACAHLESRLSIDFAGGPLVRDGLSTRRPGARGPAIIGDARYVASAFLCGHRAPACESVFDLAGDGGATRTVARDPLAGRAHHAALMAGLLACWERRREPATSTA